MGMLWPTRGMAEFTAAFAAAFAGLAALCYAAYGDSFLEHAYLYHGHPGPSAAAPPPERGRAPPACAASSAQSSAACAPRKAREAAQTHTYTLQPACSSAYAHASQCPSAPAHAAAAQASRRCAWRDAQHRAFAPLVILSMHSACSTALQAPCTSDAFHECSYKRS